MSQKARRALVTLVTLFALSLPLAAAQTRLTEAGGAAPDFFALLWSRVTAPLTALWDGDLGNGADSTGGTPAPASTPASTPAPTPASTPAPTLDGRSVIDPLG